MNVLKKLVSARKWGIFITHWTQDLVHIFLGIHSRGFFQMLCDDSVISVNKGDNVEYFEKTLLAPTWDIFTPNWAQNHLYLPLVQAILHNDWALWENKGEHFFRPILVIFIPYWAKNLVHLVLGIYINDYS